MAGYATRGADVAVTGVAICLSKDVKKLKNKTEVGLRADVQNEYSPWTKCYVSKKRTKLIRDWKVALIF